MTVKRALYQLAAELKRLKVVLFMEVIDSARVPIIKFTHINGTHADICFDQPSGPRMGNLIRNMFEFLWLYQQTHKLFSDILCMMTNTMIPS